MEQRGRFDGREAKIYRSGGMINVYYGGRYDNTPNDGHGHVKATGGHLVKISSTGDYLLMKEATP